MSHISDTAQFGDNVIIEDDVHIGDNVIIGHNSVILRGTKIGNNVSTGCNCVLGIKPTVNKRMRKTSNLTELVIESGTRIGHLVSIYSSTRVGENVFIGDHASIRENTIVGDETVIGRAAIVELNTKIGKSCTIQTQSYVTGDTVIEDNVFIGPCVSMANDKYMGAQSYNLKGPYIKHGAKIGNNASLLPGIKIGKETIVGAGSVVTKDLEDRIVAVGVPAKRIDLS